MLNSARIGNGKDPDRPLTTPALTTIHISAEAHGRQDAQAILGLEPAHLAHAPGQVIVRDSA